MIILYLYSCNWIAFFFSFLFFSFLFSPSLFFWISQGKNEKAKINEKRGAKSFPVSRHSPDRTACSSVHVTR